MPPPASCRWARLPALPHALERIVPLRRERGCQKAIRQSGQGFHRDFRRVERGMKRYASQTGAVQGVVCRNGSGQARDIGGVRRVRRSPASPAGPGGRWYQKPPGQARTGSRFQVACAGSAETRFHSGQARTGSYPRSSVLTGLNPHSYDLTTHRNGSPAEARRELSGGCSQRIGGELGGGHAHDFFCQVAIVFRTVRRGCVLEN